MTIHAATSALLCTPPEHSRAAGEGGVIGASHTITAAGTSDASVGVFPHAKPPAGTTWTRRLRDGRSIEVRVAGEADRAVLRRFCDSLTEDVLLKRFNQPVVSWSNFERLVNNTRGITLMAMHVGKPVAVAEYYDTSKPGAALRQCEVAVLVHQDHHGAGIGNMLINHVIRHARSAGFQHVEWLALRSNEAVARMSKKSGATLRVLREDREYRQASLPLWFAGLGTKPNRKLLSLLSPADRSNLLKADPNLARMLKPVGKGPPDKQADTAEPAKSKL